MTVRDLLTKAFKTARILGDGEPMSNSEATDALDVLNAILEQANIDKLLSYYKASILFPLVSNQISYTIGPTSTTPNVVAVRPVEIIDAFSRRGGVDMPVFVGTKEDYDRIQIKDTGIAGWEHMLYYEASWPKGTIYVYHKPLDGATTLHLTVMADITLFETLDDTVSMPPGYRNWLQYKTAEMLCPEYGRIFPEGAYNILMSAESALKRNNAKPLPVAQLGLDSLSSSGARYNIYSDSLDK